MSFAFNTVLLFLIIFSGLVARRAYFSKEFSKNYIKKNTFDELVGGIFIGVSLQIFGILILREYGINFDYKTIGFLLLGAKDDNNIANSFFTIEKDIGKIFLYNISLIFVGISIGFLLRVLVRKLKLDRKWKFYRFDNEWHYILSGEILEFPYVKLDGIESNAKSIGNKYVNVLTKVDDHFIIYSGVLIEFFLSNEGGLDMLCLKGVKKKVIKKDEVNPVTMEHPMNVEILVIPNSQILNVSLTYIRLKKIITKKKIGFWTQIWAKAQVLAGSIIKSKEQLEEEPEALNS